MLRRLLPRRLRHQLRQAAWCASRVATVWRRYGWGTAIAFVGAEPWLVLRMLTLGARSDATYQIPIPGSSPVHCRPESSDLEVFWQVLVCRSFDFLEPRTQSLCALDCGANIGMATLAILQQWPAADIVAVEPDPGNFALLRLNTAHVAARVTLVQAAVWSETGKLLFDEQPFRDGRQWSIRVRMPEPDERGAVPAYDIPALMELAGWDHIDLAKIDIEGAEKQLLRTAHKWLPRVDVVAVELHDADAVKGFTEAVAGQFTVARHGELSVATRPSAPRMAQF